MTFEVRRIESPEDLDAALAIRLAVFVEEQHVPLAEEIDRHDEAPWTRDEAAYVLGRLDGVPVATGRLLLEATPGAFPHIGRVAVLAPYRGHGYGRALMLALHEVARAHGAAGVTLAAQTHAIPFYERLGYVARGPVYLDAGIEHRDMDLPFTAAAS